MNKRDFAKVLHDEGILRSHSVNEAEDMLDRILTELAHWIRNNKIVHLGRFGRIVKKFRAARNFRNARTGELQKTEPKFVIEIKPSSWSHWLVLDARRKQGEKVSA